MGKRQDAKEETDPSVVWKMRRRNLRCSVCPPNRGENASRRPKHGVKKPKYKNRRK